MPTCERCGVRYPRPRSKATIVSGELSSGGARVLLQGEHLVHVCADHDPAELRDFLADFGPVALGDKEPGD